MMKPFNTHKQLEREMRREHYENLRLDTFAADVAGRMKTKTTKQLQTAAALIDDKSAQIRYVARAALMELKLRNL